MKSRDYLNGSSATEGKQQKNSHRVEEVFVQLLMLWGEMSGDGWC